MNGNHKVLILLGALGPDYALDLTRLLSHLQRLEIKMNLAGFYLAHIQNVVYKTQHVIAGMLKLLDIVIHLLFVVDVAFHQLRKADDGIHGGTDIVGHIGEEAALRPCGILRHLQRILRGFIRLLKLDIRILKNTVCRLQPFLTLYPKLQRPFIIEETRQETEGQNDRQDHKCDQDNHHSQHCAYHLRR